jgi:hypothetical protein
VNGDSLAGTVFACPGPGVYAGSQPPARSVPSSSASIPIPLQVFEAGSSRPLCTHRHTNEEHPCLRTHHAEEHPS